VVVVVVVYGHLVGLVKVARAVVVMVAYKVEARDHQEQQTLEVVEVVEESIELAVQAVLAL
jgi:hypothetical protein